MGLGKVYLLVQINEIGQETYKIGITKNNPNIRLSTLQTGNPNKINILHVYETENYKKVELWLHKKYSASKTNAKNEWFSLKNDQVLSFIADCIKINSTIEYLKKENPFC